LSLPLTAARLASLYEALRAFPPFCRLKCPPAAFINLRVSRHRDREGHYTRYLRTDDHYIVVSSAKVGHFDSVVRTLAHEMIHLHQGVARTETPGALHNAEFRRIAKRACDRFGWDLKTFIGTE
jgi:hypothetical protein